MQAEDNTMESGYNNPECDKWKTCEECQEHTGGCREHYEGGMIDI